MNLVAMSAWLFVGLLRLSLLSGNDGYRSRSLSVNTARTGLSGPWETFPVDTHITEFNIELKFKSWLNCGPSCCLSYRPVLKPSPDVSLPFLAACASSPPSLLVTGWQRRPESHCTRTEPLLGLLPAETQSSSCWQKWPRNTWKPRMKDWMRRDQRTQNEERTEVWDICRKSISITLPLQYLFSVSGGHCFRDTWHIFRGMMRGSFTSADSGSVPFCGVAGGESHGRPAPGVPELLKKADISLMYFTEAERSRNKEQRETVRDREKGN